MVSAFKSEKKKEQVLKSYDNLLKLWDVDITETDINTKYGITHCILCGEKTKPPLLMFHGVGDNSAVMWFLNAKGLSQHFYCIAVDVLGGPGKSVPNETYNKKNFSQTEWINEIADKLNIGNFYVMGTSNGAYITFNYTTKESQRVIKAVCLEGGMVVNPIRSMIGALLLLFPEILFPTRNNLIKSMKKLMSPNSGFDKKHPELIEHLLMVVKSHNQSAMFPHKLEEYDREKAKAVKEKLYFLLGEHMLEKRKGYIDILNEGGFKYKIIKNAGHGVNHEQPEIVNDEIISFLLG